MKNVHEIPVYIAQRDDSTWVAATDASPYFYLEADSKEAVLQVAARALRFYASAAPILEKLIKAGSEKPVTPRYSQEKTILGKELVAA